MNMRTVTYPVDTWQDAVAAKRTTLGHAEWAAEQEIKAEQGLFRLRTLAKFVRELPPEKFNFGLVVSEYDKISACGSICCAMGWTPAVFPDQISWGADADGHQRLFVHALKAKVNYAIAAMELFGIPTEAEALSLFSANMPLPWFSTRVVISNIKWLNSPRRMDRLYRETARNVAASIEAYVTWKRTDKQTDPENVLDEPTFAYIKES